MQNLKANQALATRLAWALIAALVTINLMGCKANAEEQAPCTSCGVVSHIENRVVKGEGSPASALAGAVIGGVIGHQFGSGRGNDAATAVGALGGAVAGIEAERRHTARQVYDVTVRLEDGRTRTVTLHTLNGLSVGDRIRVEAGIVIPA